MISDIRPLRAVAAGLLLAGCTAAAVKPQPAVDARNDLACVVGTRISNTEPCGSSGRVYTDEDIRNTGATTVAEALRLLDPSITVRR